MCAEGRNEEEETKSAATYKVNRTEIRHIEISQLLTKVIFEYLEENYSYYVDETGEKSGSDEDNQSLIN